MKRLFAGLVLAALVILGVPVSASAGQDDPYFSVASTSYSGQPSTFSVRIINNLENTTLRASIRGNGLSSALSCVPAGALFGLGPWRCTLSGSKRLKPGTFSVTAKASGNGHASKSVTRSANVSSRFSVGGHTNPDEGDRFSVSGRYDHISGKNDFRVQATVTGGGRTVAGQSGRGCSASNGSFTCSLQSAAGYGDRYSVKVSEIGSGYSRSSTTSVRVTVAPGVPSAPAFTGQTIYNVKKPPTAVSGTSSRSGLRIQVVVDPGASPNFSSPTSSCTSSGASGFWSCALPKLGKGKHTIAARAVDPADATKISPVSYRTTTLVKKAVPAAPTPTPTPSATETPVAIPDPVDHTPVISPPKTGVLPFGGLSTQLSELLALLVLALAVTALARPGPLSMSLAGRSVAFADQADAAAGLELAQRRGIGIGDNSPTWRAFGHDATDYWSRTMPGLLNRYSPFLSRLARDGVDIRAMFGTLWWLFPISGAALGLTAVGQVGGAAVTPTVGLLVTVMVIASFDALAGFVASFVFGLLLIGDVLTDKHTALSVLAVGFLWTSLPLVATSIRPFRRPGVLTLRYTWDRLADLVIAALLCGWIAQKIAQSMDLFAGRATGIPAHADAIGLIAAAAIAARVVVAHLVDVWWPERLRQTDLQEDLPEPRLPAVFGGMIVRTGVFAFLGHAFVGSCWQWWLGVALFALPDVLLIARDFLGVSWQFKLPVPVGVTHILLVVVACTLLISVAVSGADSSLEALRFAFLAAALVPAGIAAARVFHDDESKEGEHTGGSSWDMQLAGVGILVTTVILGLHGWNF